ncbi:hypothetical protein [Maribacter sp. 2304DJ31-5]|uniref:hypothetical protein n=1 Tax=Maribacter sp. 2304DJ31-5 TaxID=3386273 RepID=UPI0039BC9703
MKKLALLFFATVSISNAQNTTHDDPKVILNSPNTISLFQTNSTNGVWASGMITSDRWSVFEDATSSKERFTILPGGNVGIGTVTPNAKLEVKRSSNIGGKWNPNSSIFTTTEANNSLIMDTNEIYSSGILYVGGKGSDIIRFRSVSDTGFSDKVVIKSNGDVGIGTISPNERLQIGNAFTFHDGGSKVMMIGHATGGVDLDPSKYAAELRFNPTNGYLSLGTSSSITSAPLPQLNISKEGNIGIGTFDTGSHKLAVEGSIGAREIKVEVGTWSDFVFHKDYNLPTLKEVEIHIKEKGHLKDIPSAKEVEENGINLGEMNAKLLQKIEELTLYQIELLERLENAEKKIEIIIKQN